MLKGKIGVQVKTRRYADDTKINWKRRKLIEACQFIGAKPYFAYVRTPLPDDKRRQSTLELYFCTLDEADLYSTGKSEETRKFRPSKAGSCMIYAEEIPKGIFRNITKRALGDFGEWVVATYFRLKFGYQVILAPSSQYPGVDLIIQA